MKSKAIHFFVFLGSTITAHAVLAQTWSPEGLKVSSRGSDTVVSWDQGGAQYTEVADPIQKNGTDIISTTKSTGKKSVTTTTDLRTINAWESPKGTSVSPSWNQGGEAVNDYVYRPGSTDTMNIGVQDNGKYLSISATAPAVDLAGAKGHINEQTSIAVGEAALTDFGGNRLGGPAVTGLGGSHLKK